MNRWRVIRALWPGLFIMPLWIVFGRLCRARPMHLILHLTMAVHERLPAILGAAALVSVGVVVFKLMRVNASLRTLQSLGGALPALLQRTLIAQAALLDIPAPKVTYLDVDTPVCYTVVPGPSILISRGFIRELNALELALVVRHELVHVQRRDPLHGLLWHLIFSALLVPGFGGMERWLYDRRERRANESAGALGGTVFEALASRVRRAEMSGERSFGNAWSGAPNPLPAKRFVFVRPAIAVTIFSALLMSHVAFMSALPSLERHHC